MAAERTIVVAVEDIATAGIVGAAAAHVAMEENAGTVVLVHIVENHVVAQGLMTFALPVPLRETQIEAEAVLTEAEAALRAEYAALDHPAPTITRRLLGGIGIGTVVCEVATEVKASKIVVGGRRPHAFGRLAHPDVRSSLAHHTQIPVYVAPLQAAESQPTGGETE